MPPVRAERRNLTRIVAITLAALALVVAGAGGLLIYAAASVDRVAAAGERELVELRLQRALELLVENINGSTIWNDPVYALAAERPDPRYLQLNFGDYYADYMGHDLTLVYGRRGDLLLVSRDSEPVAAATERAFIEAVAPMVADARRAAAAKHDRERFGFDAVVNRASIVMVGDQLYLVGLGTVVRETLDAPRLDNDPVVVSAITGADFVEALRADLALAAPAFRPGDPGPLAADRAAFAVRDAAGRQLGRIEWTPDHPGRAVLLRAAPVVGLALLLLAAAAVFVLFRVRRIVDRLETNELALTEARDRAEAANDAKSRFLANMSHELRTPLNGVLGMAQVMAMGELSAAQRSQLGVLQKSGESLLELIERILTVARLEKGGATSAPTDVNLCSLLTEIAAANQPAARHAGLTLRTVLAPALAGLWRIDGEQLRQALDCLIENAIRYTPRGSVRLEADPTAQGFEIRVVDTGVGIAPERLHDLFGKFVRAEDPAVRDTAGAGIGLTLARGLVEAMGGTLRVMSTPGAGSVFIIDAAAVRLSAPARRGLAA